MPILHFHCGGALKYWHVIPTGAFIIIRGITFKEKEDLNFNEFMDWRVFKVNIPYGDYPPDGMYTSDPVIWENDYFKAVVKFTFHYE